MPGLDFETSLELKKIAEDVYENVHKPWTWHNSGVLPGGLLMSECAVAAYKTVPEGFVLHNAQTHFLRGGDAEAPLVYKVQRISTGRSFAVRSVTSEQDSKNIVFTTLSFVSGRPWKGPAMEYAVNRQAKQTVDHIRLDDLQRGATNMGPFMAFQRLHHVHQGTSRQPQSSIAPCVARITTDIQSQPGSMAHILGIVNLSDFHVLDAPLALSGINFGLSDIGDATMKLKPGAHRLFTTLNHAIHFHILDGFDANDLTYIEVTSPWARNGRAMLNTRIFSKNGLLIATCTQEVRRSFIFELRGDAEVRL